MELNMNKTFKEYLLTEKVNASTYAEIARDNNITIGMEFEFLDRRFDDVDGGDVGWEYDKENGYNITPIYDRWIEEVGEMQRKFKEFRDSYIYQNVRAQVNDVLLKNSI